MIQPHLGDCVPPELQAHRPTVRRKPPAQGVLALVPSIVMGIIIVFWALVMAAVLAGAAVVTLLVYSRLP